MTCPPRPSIPRRLSCSCYAVLTAIAAVALSQTAWAEDFVVEASSSKFRHGDHVYSHVTISGTLGITPYDGVDEDTGWLRIRAHTIAITETGRIGCAHDDLSCAHAGYPGSKAGGSGYGPTDVGRGGTPSDSSVAQPGGGGAHLGDGGDGRAMAACGQVSEAGGGSTYTSDESEELSLLGASGGAAHAGPVSTDTTLPGGNGGGAVILEAAVIIIDGKIFVDGQDAPSGLAAAGGGAGGTIIIRTNDFTFNDATAQLSARGGNGWFYGGFLGGSGGGGLIRLELSADVSSLSRDCAGGDQVGDCPATAGGMGFCEQAPAPDTCLDADGDHAANVLCGGSDCDDGDPDINPDAPERCNGTDDNCSGEPDEQVEGAAPICFEGPAYACVAGQCVPGADGGLADGGVGDGGPPETVPAIDYSGGLCTARPAAGEAGTMSALLLCLTAAVTGLLIRARRGRRNPSR